MKIPITFTHSRMCPFTSPIIFSKVQCTSCFHKQNFRLVLIFVTCLPSVSNLNHTHLPWQMKIGQETFVSPSRSAVEKKKEENNGNRKAFCVMRKRNKLNWFQPNFGMNYWERIYNIKINCICLKLFNYNLNAKVTIKWKPFNWFCLQISSLVSIWWQL